MVKDDTVPAIRLARSDIAGEIMVVAMLMMMFVRMIVIRAVAPFGRAHKWSSLT